jgi:hypothetical protein
MLAGTHFLGFSARSSERTLLLVDGSPQSGIVSQGDYAQYHFIVTPGVSPCQF